MEEKEVGTEMIDEVVSSTPSKIANIAVMAGSAAVVLGAAYVTIKVLIPFVKSRKAKDNNTVEFSEPVARPLEKQ